MLSGGVVELLMYFVASANVTSSILERKFKMQESTVPV